MASFLRVLVVASVIALSTTNRIVGVSQQDLSANSADAGITLLATQESEGSDVIKTIGEEEHTVQDSLAHSLIHSLAHHKSMSSDIGGHSPEMHRDVEEPVEVSTHSVQAGNATTLKSKCGILFSNFFGIGNSKKQACYALADTSEGGEKACDGICTPASTTLNGLIGSCTCTGAGRCVSANDANPGITCAMNHLRDSSVHGWGYVKVDVAEGKPAPPGKWSRLEFTVKSKPADAKWVEMGDASRLDPKFVHTPAFDGCLPFDCNFQCYPLADTKARGEKACDGSCSGVGSCKCSNAAGVEQAGECVKGCRCFCDIDCFEERFRNDDGKVDFCNAEALAVYINNDLVQRETNFPCTSFLGNPIK